MEVEQQVSQNELTKEEWEVFEASHPKPNVFNRMGFRNQKMFPILDEKEVAETFWNTFFDGEPIDEVHKEIRSILFRMYGGLDSNTEERSFAGFQEWMNEYFSLSSNNKEKHRLKVMYFARFHHSRMPHGNHKPQILHVLLQLRQGGSSNLMSTIANMCPKGVAWLNTTPEHIGAFSPGTITMQEIHAPKSKQDYSSDDARNNFKSRSTSSDSQITASFYLDEETQERKVSYDSNRGNIIAYTHDALENFDDNLLSRFIVLTEPNTQSSIMRPRDFTRIDVDELAAMNRDHVQIHALYYMVDMALQSGVTGDPIYGMDMSPVRRVASRLGITSSRDIERLCEMSRCITICSVVWVMLVSTNAKEFNLHCFRTLLTHLIITEEMILEALSMLAF